MSDPIIVIGAGFGGLTCAFELAKRRSRLADRDIILIDQSAYHLYTPLLYEVATGYDPREAEKPDREFEEELRRGAAFAFEDGLRRRMTALGIHFVNEEVTAIDWNGQSLSLSDGRRLTWSDLVLAVGGDTDFYGIAGLEQHSYQLKTLRHALAIRRKTRALLQKKQRGEEPHVSIVIGGAGPTGVEFAGELVRFVGKAIECGVLRKSDITITIVEATSRVLPQFDKQFSEWAQRRLEHWCVKFFFDSCIHEVRDGHVVLTPRPLRLGEPETALVCEFRAEKRKDVDADLVVWTGGVRGAAVLEKWGLSVDHKGRVEVDLGCRLKDREHIYAIGDAATMIDPKTKRPVIWLAQTAIAQGQVVAENITGLKAEYPFPYLHAIIPVGAKYAIADIYGFKFRGFLGWIARQLADLRYFLTIMSFSDAVRVWFRGARIYTQND